MKKIQAFGHFPGDGGVKVFNKHVFRQQVADAGPQSWCKLTMEYGNKRTVNMNAWFWAGVVIPTMVRWNQDGEEYTDHQVYRMLEQAVSTEEKFNPLSGEYEEVVVPLKTLDSDTFLDRANMAREAVHLTSPDIYLKTPWEYYGMPYHIWIDWKHGKIAMKKALALSEQQDVLTE
ncbi:MAG: hypothetical protein CL666_04650 [Balneola sp.]|nr:hypothetical protein [Balneola sp.]|tara:strand:+ start:41010 stop:41534 length:525 start_codon:yes stop_codon:yes gene_type:complete